jgi:hypothetical protein
MNAGSVDCINALVGSNLGVRGFQNQKADSTLVDGCGWRSRWISGRDSLNVQSGNPKHGWVGSMVKLNDSIETTMNHGLFLLMAQQ